MLLLLPRALARRGEPLFLADWERTLAVNLTGQFLCAQRAIPLLKSSANASIANLSSASVLHILRDTIAKPPPSGSPGLMLAMGPGFCSELVLLRWH